LSSRAYARKSRGRRDRATRRLPTHCHSAVANTPFSPANTLSRLPTPLSPANTSLAPPLRPPRPSTTFRGTPPPHVFAPPRAHPLHPAGNRCRSSPVWIFLLWVSLGSVFLVPVFLTSVSLGSVFLTSVSLGSLFLVSVSLVCVSLSCVSLVSIFRRRLALAVRLKAVAITWGVGCDHGGRCRGCPLPASELGSGPPPASW
jgi:hypothetical protein